MRLQATAGPGTFRDYSFHKREKSKRRMPEDHITVLTMRAVSANIVYPSGF
jgi:hypothetical protein